MDLLTESYKRCPKCGEEKPLTSFHRSKRRKDGRQSTCADCMKIMRRTTQRGSDLKRKFGITVDQYDSILLSQNNGCAICGDSKNRGGNRLAVDHDHDTGRVRGLLCHRCNTAIGLFSDDIELLKSAIYYLIRSEECLEHGFIDRII